MAAEIEKPELVMIVGGMFSGKTDWLQHRANEYLIDPRYRKLVVWFRPQRDSRQADREQIKSHRGVKISKKVLKATIIKNPQELYRKALDFQVIIIDEAQFLDPSLAGVVFLLHLAGKKLFVAGLDLDWCSDPFPTMQAVMFLPGVKVFHVKGLCRICGKKATMSQLLDKNGNPVSIEDGKPRIIVGGKEKYRPLCAHCWFETTPGTRIAMRQKLSWLKPDDFARILVPKMV